MWRTHLALIHVLEYQATFNILYQLSSRFPGILRLLFFVASAVFHRELYSQRRRWFQGGASTVPLGPSTVPWMVWGGPLIVWQNYCLSIQYAVSTWTTYLREWYPKWPSAASWRPLSSAEQTIGWHRTRIDNQIMDALMTSNWPGSESALPLPCINKCVYIQSRSLRKPINFTCEPHPQNCSHLAATAQRLQ